MSALENDTDEAFAAWKKDKASRDAISAANVKASMPPPVEKSEDPGLIHDLLVNAGQGATLGFGDELLGGAQTAGDVISGKSKLEDLYNTYRKHQQENEKSADESFQRHPVLGTAAQIAGGLLIPGGAILEGAQGATAGARALNAAATGAKLGAIAGIGNSKANIEDPGTLLEDSAKTAAIGGIGAGLIKGASDKIGSGISNYIAERPSLQRAVEGYNQGIKGNNTGTISGRQNITNEINNTNDTLTKNLLSPVDEVGKDYGNMIDSAKSTIDLDNHPEFTKSLSDNQNLLGPSIKKMPEYQNIVNGNGTARDFKQLQLALRGLSKTMGAGDSAINKDSVSDLLQNTSNVLNSSLPEGQLSDLNSAFSKVRGIPETLLGDKSLSGLDYSDRAPEVQDAIKNIGRKIGSPNIYGDEARDTWKQMMDKVQELQKTNPNYKFNADDMNNMIGDIGRKNALLGSTGGVTGKAGVAGATINPLDIAKEGIKTLPSLTNAVGLGVQSKANPFNWATAADPVLSAGAQRLKQVPGLKFLGDSLDKAINNKSSAAKYSTMFAIMQNPEARKAMGVDIKDQEHEEQ